MLAIALVAFTAPLFHYNDTPVVAFECTPKIAFYRLKGLRGRIRSFSYNNGSYVYSLDFDNRELSDVEVPETCLQPITKEKK